jgi:hypothetical protein
MTVRRLASIEPAAIAVDCSAAGYPARFFMPFSLTECAPQLRTRLHTSLHTSKRDANVIRQAIGFRIRELACRCRAAPRTLSVLRAP